MQEGVTYNTILLLTTSYPRVLPDAMCVSSSYTRNYNASILKCLVK